MSGADTSDTKSVETSTRKEPSRVLYVCGHPMDSPGPYIADLTLLRVDEIESHHVRYAETAMNELGNFSQYYAAVVMRDGSIPKNKDDSEFSANEGYDVMRLAQRKGIPVILLSLAGPKRNTHIQREFGIKHVFDYASLYETWRPALKEVLLGEKGLTEKLGEKAGTQSPLRTLESQ